MRWQELKEHLQHSLPESTFCLWIAPLKCAAESEGIITLVAPNQFFRSWVEDNYLPVIRGVVSQNCPELEVRVVVEENAGLQAALPARNEIRRVANGGDEAGSGQLRLPSMPVKKSVIRTLHPRYTFDEFMVGKSNMLAKNASEILANGGNELGRSLYIGGGSGLGKSHLTHAIAHHIINNFPETRLHYLTAKQLTSDMVRAIKNSAMEQFKDKYYSQCDVLLLDDIHTLTGKKTQEELAAALDVLMETGKRVIFTGAMPPKDIIDLDIRVRSRLSASLIAHINPPDVDTRTLIVRHKAKRKNLELADELVQYIADHVKGDIRQIESAIVGLKAKASLLATPPDRDMVREVLSSIIDHHQELTADLIRDFLASQFKVPVEDLLSKSRKKTVAFPRQVSMYLARKLTEQPLSDIGRAFNRDHSTVVHSIRVITDTIARSASVRGQINHLTLKLQEKFQ